MPRLLKTIEATPSVWPTKPSGMSPNADALPQEVVWRMIEGYTTTRFSERECTWYCHGAGEFDPPLDPATITSSEFYDEYMTYLSVSVIDGPLGAPFLPESGYWRINANVGNTTTPEDVQEAYRRLAEYLSEDGPGGGVTSQSHDVGPITISESRDPKWQARAIYLCGAASLLRPYRRARHV